MCTSHIHGLTTSSRLPLLYPGAFLPRFWKPSGHTTLQFWSSSLRSPTSSYTWRLNESHLSNHVNGFDRELRLKEYFSLNDPAHTSPMCVWAAHKATVRDTLIWIAIRCTKHYESTPKQKERALHDLLKDHKKSLQADLRNQIDPTRLELNVCLAKRVEKNLWWSKAKFYF